MTPAPGDARIAMAKLGSALRDDLQRGITNIRLIELPPMLRLCRFTDSEYGPNDGLISPWWIAEDDFHRIVDARTASRAAHGNDKSLALSLGFLARMVLAIPQEWQSDGTAKSTTMNLLLRGDLKAPVSAFTGTARMQRETTPNGIELRWEGWSSVRQFFILAFSRRPPVGAGLADVTKVMTIGAPTYIKSTPLYQRP